MEDKNKDLDTVIDELVEKESPEPKEPDPTAKEPEPDPKEPDPKSTETDPEPEDSDPKDSDPKDPEPESDPKDKSKSDPEDSSVIRKLREEQRKASQQAKESEALLDRIAESQGITREQLAEKLQEDADKKEAKEKNITPEVQRQLREQKEAIENLKQEREREVFNTKFNRLTEQHPMSDEEARQFVKSAIDLGVDLGNPNVDFTGVYFALNHSRLLDEARKDERQKTLAGIEEQDKAPGNTKKRDQSGDVKKGDIDAALNEIID